MTPEFDDINERKRINDTLAQFYALDSWTPAMGAMLISGISPLNGWTEIPDVAPSLLNSAIPAKKHVIYRARQALAQWEDYCADRLENDPSHIPPERMAPDEFLIWCLADCDQTFDPFTPEWLSYWLAATGIHYGGSVPPPMPGNLVTYSSDMQRAVLVIQNKVDNTDQSFALQSPEDLRYVAQMCESIQRSSRLAIKGVIVLALKESRLPKSTPDVWAHLCEIAKSGKYKLLKYQNDAELRVLSSGSDGKLYTQDALHQFLTRYRDGMGCAPPK